MLIDFLSNALMHRIIAVYLPVYCELQLDTYAVVKELTSCTGLSFPLCADRDSYCYSRHIQCSAVHVSNLVAHFSFQSSGVNGATTNERHPKYRIPRESFSSSARPHSHSCPHETYQHGLYAHHWPTTCRCEYFSIYDRKTEPSVHAGNFTQIFESLGFAPVFCYYANNLDFANNYITYFVAMLYWDQVHLIHFVLHTCQFRLQDCMLCLKQPKVGVSIKCSIWPGKYQKVTFGIIPVCLFFKDELISHL